VTVVPRCHIDTCFWYPKKKDFVWNTKSKSYFNMTLFEGEFSRCQIKIWLHRKIAIPCKMYRCFGIRVTLSRPNPNIPLFWIFCKRGLRPNQNWQIPLVFGTKIRARILVWHRDPPLKKRHIEKWLAFSTPKTTSSFGYKKQVSIWQRGSSVKNSHIEDDLILVFKKQTPTVKNITVRLRIPK
jgi:hypothetical protein